MIQRGDFATWAPYIGIVAIVGVLLLHIFRARSVPSEAGVLTIRVKVWQAGTVVALGIVTSLCVVLVAFDPGAWPLLIGPLLVLPLGFWRWSLVMRLEVTPTVVRARAGGWRGQQDLEAPRIEICEIHYCPSRIVFQGTHKQPLMEPYPHWTLKQVLQVADLLDVPVYDHRGRFHLQELPAGRLVRADSSADWWPGL